MPSDTTGNSTAALGFSNRLQPLITRAFSGIWGRAGEGNNGARVHPALRHESWSAVADGMHNLTTDLTHFNGAFYLVFSSSPWHIGSHKSRIRLLRSTDGKQWESLRDWKVPSGDIRDPKLSVIDGRLLLFVLKNSGWLAEPGSTCFAESSDGETWTELQDCEPRGWLYWRPKAWDGNWYVPAYWNQHGKAILLKSRNGRDWSVVSTIHEGDHLDETDIEFLPDGRMLATARLEIEGNLLGHNESCTLVAIAEPPYTQWKSVRCPTTRLDGPNLFRYRDQIFALGRRHEDKGRWPQRKCSVLGKKRTALFRVTEAGMQHLSDLPSCGDTGYPGIALQGDDLYVSYYTNDIQQDYRWGVGMFLPSEIRMARLSLENLYGLFSFNSLRNPSTS